jgi:hypothetical protein
MAQQQATQGKTEPLYVDFKELFEQMSEKFGIKSEQSIVIDPQELAQEQAQQPEMPGQPQGLEQPQGAPQAPGMSPQDQLMQQMQQQPQPGQQQPMPPGQLGG